MTAAIGQLDTLERTHCREAVEGYFSTRRMVTEHAELFEKILAEHA